MLSYIFYIKANQFVTLFYTVSVFYKCLKSFSVQIYCIHADMQKILCAVIASQPDRVF